MAFTSTRLRFFFTLYLGLQFFYAHAQIERVEPPNWWVGMRNPEVQLLVHGKQIGATTPRVRYPGVTLVRSTRGESDNYLFLDLKIAPTAKPGRVELVFSRKGAAPLRYRYELKLREQKPADFVGFDASDAICLIVPDRFANGDSSNDVVTGMREAKVDRSFPGGRHGGDIQGIIQHLDYLQQLGYTAIWPTPMLENNMPGYSYHGYAITDHYRVDPRYGTLETYQALSKAMKLRGMKLIFDEVLNHTGSHYWWMNDLPFANWLNRPETKTLSNHRRTVNQDLYASQYDKSQWNEGWFDFSMPDLNGRNPFLANYLIQNTIWWIETLCLGGVRQDTYGYSDKTLLRNWSCRIMEEYPRFSLVGEEWSTNPLITSYWQQGKVNHDGYQSCLNTVMDFPLQAALVQSLNGEESESYNPPFTKLYEAVANDFVYPNPRQLLVMGDNHDMNRLFMQLKQNVSRFKMALTYLFTTRGIPQVLYGSEILMDNSPHHKNDGLIRSDLPGGWAGDTVNVFTKQGLSATSREVQDYFARLLNWRKKNPVIANGQLMHFAPFDGVYVYFRYNQQQTIMVIMNANTKAYQLDTGRFAERMGKATSATQVIDGTILHNLQQITVPAQSAMVLELNK